MYLHNRDNPTVGRQQCLNASTTVLPDVGIDVAESVPSFVADAHDRTLDPVIVRFRAALMRIKTNELERLYHRLPELDECTRQEIGQLADCLVATVLHPPLKSLQIESRVSPSRGLLDALQRLFKLDE